MNFSQMLPLLILSFVSCTTVAEQTAAAVRMLDSDANSFSFKTGEYVVSYKPDPQGKGWIRVKRNGVENFAIATKLANGQNFDVTDFGAGEGMIYQWKDIRKDSKMFRSLNIKDSHDIIDITIHTERQWANFESHLIAYKNRPCNVQECEINAPYFLNQAPIGN